MTDQIFSVKLVKKDGKLTHQNSGDLSVYRNFVDSLEEGQIIETFFEANNKSNSKAQLAKVHVCIRKLANEIGYTFEEMKLSIKQRAGLVYGELDTSEGYAKSFADCSNEEMQLVFEALNEAGEMVNIQF
jgi:hypothetical protein